MRLKHTALLILAAAVAACNDNPGSTDPTPPPPPPPPPPAPSVLLRDVVASNLPSPYYHFEYDGAGRVKGASFASDFLVYDVVYDGDRISEMRNNILVNHDRLVYVYDESGRVAAVKYTDVDGRVFTALFFTYDGPRLTGIERDRRVDAGFVIDKKVTLSYYADGNLMEIREHRPVVDGQPTESNTVDRFEDYDDNINVDAFGLIHDDFFDHLVLLPGVQLQKGNPRREIRTGDGINFTVDYSYSYDGQRRPLLKSGAVTITNGSDAGRTLQISTAFTYY